MTLTFKTYKPQYAEAFKELNLHWLERFFTVEPHDYDVLNDPETHIINPGGEILVALLDNKVIGVVALMPDENGEYELTKMAVDVELRGQKIGQQLLAHTIEFARNKGLKTLILYSSRKLENALHLYRKYGFVEEPLQQPNPYLRADIKMRIQL